MYNSACGWGSETRKTRGIDSLVAWMCCASDFGGCWFFFIFAKAVLNCVAHGIHSCNERGM